MNKCNIKPAQLQLFHYDSKTNNFNHEPIVEQFNKNKYISNTLAENVV